MIGRIPIVDVGALRNPNASSEAVKAVANALGKAFATNGFASIINHGISQQLRAELSSVSTEFFSLPLEEKNNIRMELSGKAWRGFFPLGDELTSGKPDLKEGLYFGTEGCSLEEAHLPLHGFNQWPKRPIAMSNVVQKYMNEMTGLGHQLMAGVAISLQQSPDWFRRSLTASPTTLFRIFHYPAVNKQDRDGGKWGVGEHTDYGLLTILAQDSSGGLEVKSRVEGEWIEVEPNEEALVVNIGDILDGVTMGHYRSTPHRVRAIDPDQTPNGRYSWPFFFDPSWRAVIRPVDGLEPAGEDDADSRWDRSSVRALHGKEYGEYLLGKVGKVFPDLMVKVSGDE